MTNTVARTRVRGYRQISLLLVLLIIAAPVAGQRPAGAPPRQTPKLSDPTFETLLATDAYKMYGEVRNVGQLLSTGGAGEIVDPIIKLADPGKEFKSIVSFLKKNSEALASSRLLFASWPARTDVPEFFVAIEFPTSEDAAKFAPKLETFLPTVLPPVTPSPEPSPVTAPKSPETGSASPAQAAKPSTPASSSNEAANKNQVKPAENRGTTQTAELPYLITHVGNLVCI
ncbi:MAG TPA: hypothetical protein VKD91_23315, partial [Pyrinomonadaceae bacterium]|nr:hypothetical protein [Pyrinomonadaceae bacterium]